MAIILHSHHFNREMETLTLIAASDWVNQLCPFPPSLSVKEFLADCYFDGGVHPQEFSKLSPGLKTTRIDWYVLCMRDTTFSSNCLNGLFDVISFCTSLGCKSLAVSNPIYGEHAMAHNVRCALLYMAFVIC